MSEDYSTVVRFCGTPELRDTLVELGKELNKTIPDFFNGFDSKHPNRFSTGVAKGYVWERQKQAIVEFLDSSKHIVSWARAAGVHIQFDVAVWAWSFRPSVAVRCMLFDQDLMAKLADVDVSIVVSVYGRSRAGRKRGVTKQRRSIGA